jgi:acetyl-CoA acetyltransferase
MVAVKSHKYGALNPRAQYQKPLTLEAVLNGKMIAEPMTQFMCSGIGDGSAAVIFMRKEKSQTVYEQVYRRRRIRYCHGTL